MKKYKKNKTAFLFFWLSLLFPADQAGAAIQPTILLNVPFTSQAPLARWNDPKQQDACEEASALMAVSWARRKNIEPKQAEKEIIAIADFQLNKYGGYQDTSAQDTVKRIFQDYYQFTGATTTIIKSAEDIIKELKNGNLVIAPTDGRKLKNPYYTRPGPERHNLLIRGYDFSTKEFIANDAGTRRGNGFRYPAAILINALRDYPTGHKQPIKDNRKVIIIIKPE